VVALLAAASTFVLPAWDAILPGGAIAWQVGALALALAGALWVRRQVPPGTSRAGVWLLRLIATAALILALAWAGGVALLWLLWPR
jgi:hypothetical protein